MVGHCPLDLDLGVLGVGKAVDREMDIGNGDLRKVRVVQERQDRMIKGRGRELDPADLGEPFVLGDDERHDLALLLDEERLLVLGESRSLLHQPFEERVVVLKERIEPGKIEPDLEIEIILGGIVAGGVQKVVRRNAVAPAVEQLPVGGIGLDHGVPVRHERVPEQEQLVLLIKFRGRLERQGKELVRGIVLHVVLDLLEKRRNKIERLVNIGEIVRGGRACRNSP